MTRSRPVVGGLPPALNHAQEQLQAESGSRQPCGAPLVGDGSVRPQGRAEHEPEKRVGAQNFAVIEKPIFFAFS